MLKSYVNKNLEKIKSYPNMIEKDMIKSDFHIYREKYNPCTPSLFSCRSLVSKSTPVSLDPLISSLFPSISANQPEQINFLPSDIQEEEIQSPLRIACVLSGGQAAGGHNVILGLYEYVKKRSPNSQLFGFLNGPIGIYTGQFVELDHETISFYKNRGGFDMIKSGRNKIETEEQFKKSLQICQTLQLDGLVVIGGDDSNTNACMLAEYFLKNNCKTRVVGCPKTIDGDLKNEMVEVSFGYDTACKTYSELIGNLMIDTLSTKKYYHFIRLMGRSASHITLECSLMTRPNCTFIGEEVEHKNLTLQNLVDYLVEVIVQRAENKMDFGIILVPEGLIEFIPEVSRLIKEINQILADEEMEGKDVDVVYQFILAKLTSKSAELMKFLPKQISNQLLLDRDPHGNVQVAKIETEKLLIICVQSKLDTLKSLGKYTGKFSSQSHYLGYEGRCAFPSKFDCDYCYNLGMNAAILVEKGYTGVMSCIGNLKAEVEEWVPSGYPLVAMMNVEVRKGKNVPVIKKALTDLNGKLFKIFEEQREKWAKGNWYRQIGPIQFEFKSKYDTPYLVAPPEEDFDKNGDYQSEYCQFGEQNLSYLNKARTQQQVQIPQLLTKNKYKVALGKSQVNQNSVDLLIVKKHLNFLLNTSNKIAEVVPDLESETTKEKKDLRIGVCFNARQSPGGHNIIDGLLKFVTLNGGKLFGFLNGTKGIFEQKYIEITEENFSIFRNQGGYHFLGRSADKIRSETELIKTLQTCSSLNLSGLVLIGASHTFTDAAYLTNYFIQNNQNTCVITVPCTIDNNVGHHMLEQSVGFDSAAKVYSQLVGNIMIDSASAVKYWYFMRLMGRDPSHLVLECALQTRPNVTIISEEIVQKGFGLDEVVNQIADVICLRAEKNKNFGTVLIPEGLLPHLSLFKLMIDELNEFFKTNESEAEKLLDPEFANKVLSPWAAARFVSLPDFIQNQLVLEREVNGGVQLSQIETERLLAHMVEKELKRRKSQKQYKGTFSPICHFFGYQGRSCTPSTFDCQLASTYGFTAGVLIEAGLTGYATTARGLTSGINEWHMGGIPLVGMVEVKSKSAFGLNMSVVKSQDVDLKSQAMITLQSNYEGWKTVDYYTNSGPTQFFGEKMNEITQTLKLNHRSYYNQLQKVFQMTNDIEQSARFGVHEDLLQFIINNLENLKSNLEIIEKKYI